MLKRRQSSSASSVGTSREHLNICLSMSSLPSPAGKARGSSGVRDDPLKMYGKEPMKSTTETNAISAVQIRSHGTRFKCHNSRAETAMRTRRQYTRTNSHRLEEEFPNTHRSEILEIKRGPPGRITANSTLKPTCSLYSSKTSLTSSTGTRCTYGRGEKKQLPSNDNMSAKELIKRILLYIAYREWRYQPCSCSVMGEIFADLKRTNSRLLTRRIDSMEQMEWFLKELLKEVSNQRTKPKKTTCDTGEFRALLQSLVRQFQLSPVVGRGLGGVRRASMLQRYNVMVDGWFYGGNYPPGREMAYRPRTAVAYKMFSKGPTPELKAEGIICKNGLTKKTSRICSTLSRPTSFKAENEEVPPASEASERQRPASSTEDCHASDSEDDATDSSDDSISDPESPKDDKNPKERIPPEAPKTRAERALMRHQRHREAISNKDDPKFENRDNWDRCDIRKLLGTARHILTFYAGARVQRNSKEFSPDIKDSSDSTVDRRKQLQTNKR